MSKSLIGDNFMVNIKLYLAILFFLGTCTCGSYGFRLDEDDWTRIVGGTPAAPNSIPFQVYFGSF